MSAPTSAPSAPFQQWQNFYPAGPGPAYPYGGFDGPTTVGENIYASVVGTAERTKQQAANDIARDILRAVDANGSNNSHITEINSANLASAIERNGAQGMSTTERINKQIAAALAQPFCQSSSKTSINYFYYLSRSSAEVNKSLFLKKNSLSIRRPVLKISNRQ
jgi:hypothetical protein